MLKEDLFYETNDGSIFCGECANKVIAATEAGLFTGDEGVTAESYAGPLDDNDPLQCDDCLKQNAAYDEEMD